MVSRERGTDVSSISECGFACGDCVRFASVKRQFHTPLLQRCIKFPALENYTKNPTAYSQARLLCLSRVVSRVSGVGLRRVGCRGREGEGGGGAAWEGAGQLMPITLMEADITLG